MDGRLSESAVRVGCPSRHRTGPCGGRRAGGLKRSNPWVDIPPLFEPGGPRARPHQLLGVVVRWFSYGPGDAGPPNHSFDGPGFDTARPGGQLPVHRRSMRPQYGPGDSQGERESNALSIEGRTGGRAPPESGDTLPAAESSPARATRCDSGDAGEGR